MVGVGWVSLNSACRSTDYPAMERYRDSLPASHRCNGGRIVVSLSSHHVSALVYLWHQIVVLHFAPFLLTWGITLVPAVLQAPAPDLAAVRFFRYVVLSIECNAVGVDA